MGEFNLEMFRQLLKKGIGNRTQKEYAAQTGISPATINRMLKEADIPRPKIPTLEKMSAKMNTVTLSDLMRACGYEVAGVNVMVASVEYSISDFFDIEEKKYRVFGSMEEIIGKLEKFVMLPVGSRASISVKNNADIPTEIRARGAEIASTIHMIWDYDGHICDTEFNIYYAETTGGQLVVLDTDIGIKKGEGYIGRTIVRKKTEPTKEDRIIRAIFGEVYGPDGTPNELLPDVQAGYGFEVDGTPAGFKDFLVEHAATFCATKEESEMYEKVVNGEDPEDVFKHYGTFTNGPLAVIAEIMTRESGDHYSYMKKDKKLPDEEQNACIVYFPEYYAVEALDNKRYMYLRTCAKTLKIPEFGVVYYRTTCMVNRNLIYRTDSSWFE